MRTRVKRARNAVEEAKDSPESIETAVIAALRQIARAAQKGVIHKKTASRKISRLTRAANKAKPTIQAAHEASKAAAQAGKGAAKKAPARKPAPAKSEPKK